MTAKERLDPAAFPLLSEWLGLAPAAFRERVDQLAGEVRREAAAPAQQALRRAVEVLPALFQKYGG